MYLYRRSVIAGLCLLATPARAALPSGALYIDGGQSSVGFVLVPGRGQPADGYVVGPLRKALRRDLGCHTVSLKLPTTTQIEQVTPAVALAEMKTIYPASLTMIRTAVDFLRDQHGVKRVYLLGHSMGATIVTTALTQDGSLRIAGLVVISVGDYGEPPFNTTANLSHMQVPVLDIYGDATGVKHPLDASLAANDVKLAAARKPYESPRYRQVRISGAGHAFVGQTNEAALNKAIATWIAEQEGRR
jgi:hypothetical protein